MNLKSKHLQTQSVWRVEWERVVLPFFPKNKLTLDCGCGPAYYRNLFGNNYVGIDVQRHFPKDGRYVRASVAGLPFREASFECVLAVALFEHVEDPKRALLEICRVLENGGCVLLGTPSRYGAKYETLKTFRGYDIEDLECLARDQKLSVKRKFKVGGAFAILFAEIENVFRPKIQVVKNELPSFEGEPYYNLFEHSLLGKILLKIREMILRLTVVIELHFPFKTLYQGACIFALKCNTDDQACESQK